MSFTLLLCGAAVAIVAMYVMTSSRHNLQPALAGNTLVGISDPASETMAGPHVTPAPVAGEWHLMPVADLSAAEDLLDSLENHGIVSRELVVLGNSSFAVRWR